MKITTSSIFFFLIVVSTVLLSAEGPSLAAPTYSVAVNTVGIGPVPGVDQAETSGSAVSTATSYTFAVPSEGTGSYSASAVARPGSLSARSSSSVRVAGFPSPNFLDSSATARFFLDDIVISGPGSTVPLALNLDVNGIITMSTSAISDVFTMNGQAKAESTVRLAGFFSFGANNPEEPDFGGMLYREELSYQGCSAATSTCGTFLNPPSATGIFEAFTTGDPDALTPIFDAPVGVPLSLTMELFVKSTVLWGADIDLATLNASNSTNFESAVRFPTAGPVFNLPAGYTANSVNGLIVNNQWTGGGVTPVPTLSLWGGFALMGVLCGLGASRGGAWDRRPPAGP